jgi:DNA-binding NarL/FixJ family response regulator
LRIAGRISPRPAAPCRGTPDGGRIVALYRVVLADDHRIVRDGLRALLQKEPGFEMVGEAEDGVGALELARKLAPDVLLVDISMPRMNGIETVRRLRAELPEIRILCLSVRNEEQLVLAMIEAGAAGYVLKESSFQELITAIRQVMAGNIYISSALVGIFVAHYRAHADRSAANPVFAPLTARERELVQLFSEGYSTAEIALQLHVSKKTVATHRENIQQKLRITGIAEMTRYALREGLSSLDAPFRTAPR